MIGRNRAPEYTTEILGEFVPTVPEGHKHRVTAPGNPRKIPRTPAEPRRDPAEPPERPHGALGETPAEPLERQISSESLAEGCAPRMVTLRNFRIRAGYVMSSFAETKVGWGSTR